MADPKRLRDLKIKTGVVKRQVNLVNLVREVRERRHQGQAQIRRLAKEKVYYQKESEKEREKLEKFKADDTKDDHDIKKQEEVMQESLMMGPDCQRKLIAAWDELSKLTESESDLAESEEHKQAIVILKETQESAQRA